MNYYELQQRANKIVENVNNYEASLTGSSANENDLLDQHKYVDLFSLRPVFKRLFADVTENRLSTTLLNDVDINLISSFAPAPIAFVNFQNNSVSILNTSEDATSNDYKRAFNIDLYNNSNMIAVEAENNKYINRDARIKNGLNYSYSANIYDALITESQLANVFRWNTSNPDDVSQNNIIFSRQVPGVVMYYLGSGYNGIYTATIPHSLNNSTLQSVNYNTPAIYGSYYRNKDYTQSQVGEEMGAEACKVFIPSSTYFSGRLINPQQIYQPTREVGEANIDKGYNYQGKAVYHELVFKQRRTGCKDANLDFKYSPSSGNTIPEPEPPDYSINTTDNDPQGLATRLVLAKQKQYYYRRPWFDELDELTDKDTSILAGNIISNSKVDIPLISYTAQGNAQIDTENNIFYNNPSNGNGFLSYPIEMPEELDSFIIYCSFNNNRHPELNSSANVYISLGYDTVGNFQVNSNVPVGANVLSIALNSKNGGVGEVYETRLFTKTSNGADRIVADVYRPESGWTNPILQPNIKTKLKIEYVKAQQTISIYYDTTDSGAFTLLRTVSNITDINTSGINYLLIGCNYIGNNNPAINRYQNQKVSYYIDDTEVYINSIKQIPMQASQRNMTDSEFYNQYHLDYETWAKSVNKPL